MFQKIGHCKNDMEEGPKKLDFINHRLDYNYILGLTTSVAK